MNRVILCGRLVRDPDIRYTQGQSSMCVAKFTLACDRRYKKENEQTADFISCIAFGKTGEFIEKYVNKGTKIMVEGRWQTGSYTNKDGQKVYTNDCVIDGVEFAESKKSAADGQATPPPAPEDDFMNLAEGIDEDMPFG